MTMNIEEIKAIAEIVSANDLAELKLEQDGFTLQIKRGAKTVVASAPAAVAVAPAVLPATPTPAPAGNPAEDQETIDAPLVGTFYRSSSPEAAPFVKVGDKVTPDTVVCIIEAMKVMNEVKAEKSGVVKEILAENGNPVEFGQALFVIA